MKISNKSIYISVYVFLYINIFIFLFGFMKWYIALPVALGCMAGIWLSIEKIPAGSIEISRGMIITAVVSLALMMIAAGHGGLCPQAPDWSARNAILNDLIDKPWPVYYKNGSALVYYLGYFLLPSAIGKIAGFKAAYWVMYLYGVFGIFIVYLLLVKLLKATDIRRQVIILLMLILFSNVEELKTIFTSIAEGVVKLFDSSYGRPFIMIGFTPFFELYFSVFNQIIPAFVVLALFLDSNKRLGSIAVAAVPLIIYSPFQLIFIFCLVVIAVVRQILSSSIKETAKQVFTLQNIAILVVLAPVLIMYLWGNLTEDKPDVLKFHRIEYGRNLYVYIVFVVVQVVIYAIFLYRRYKRDPYFYASVATLMILPLFQLGYWNDLCTRTSAAALFIFMVYTIELWFYDDMNIKANRVCAIALAVLVGISAAKPANEIVDKFRAGAGNFASQELQNNIHMPFDTFEGIEALNSADLQYNFFAYNAKDQIFFKCLARE